MSRKDHEAVMRAAEQRGWTVQRRQNGHVVLIHPSGAKVWASGTPKDSRAHQKLERDLRLVETRGYVREPIHRGA